MLNHNIDNVTNTIGRLKETSLGDLFTLDENTDFYASWPTLNQLLNAGSSMTAILGSSIPAESKSSVESRLNKAYGLFRNTLPLNTDTSDTDSIREILSVVKEVEQELYHSSFPRHLSLPYLVPTLTLHTALIQAHQLLDNSTSNKDENCATSELIFNSITYLNDALNSAYLTRFNQIEVIQCGPQNKYSFIKDTKNNKALSDLFDHSKNINSVKAVKNKNANQIALDYVKNIDFSTAHLLVDGLVNHFEGHFSNKNSYSTAESYNKQIDVWNTELARSVDNPNLALRDDPIWVSDDKDCYDYVKEYYSTVAIAMIGDLPIPGAATLSAVTGLFVSWLMPDQASKWKKYAEAIGNYIDQQLTEQELNNIENELIVAEEEFDAICKFLEANSDGWHLGDEFPDSEVETRFIDLINSVKLTKQRIFNPNCELHNTFPYFDRLFTLYGSVIGSATVSLNSYNTYDEFQDFYADARAYLDGAMKSAVDYRTEKLRGDYGGASNVSRMYDGQRSSFYSDKRPLNGSSNRWDGYYALIAHLDVELGYDYPNRLKLVAGLRNFDKFSERYNEFWASKNPAHVAILPLYDDWKELVETKRGEANGKRSTIDSGYSHWSNGPGVQHNLYFGENMYRSHFFGPRLYVEDSNEEGFYVALQDYPTFKGQNPLTGATEIIVPIEDFNKVELSPCYSLVVYSEENFEGSSFTFSNGGNKFNYQRLDNSGFTIKSLKVVYTKDY
ncbi:hypothetical protein [Vibrio nigripulchritudo]|uniref:hypothetical protein n=1 Tax=Vibrio nigripulchritudo TaxID=28173 RepID=UPI0005FA925A|nr:hypothetical protein [Vibrio nigripulchritudo]KJY74769.1 hypothetical protein TW74_18855 [Vibrio nigripulchritudo]